MRSLILPLLATLTIASTMPFGLAQAQYVEAFDALGSVDPGGEGPAGLIDDGWIFRNQSDPAGSGTWRAGSLFAAQAGGGYLAVDSSSTDFFGGRVSTWAILPDVPNQVAGDTLTLHVRAVSSSNDDTLEVRYSPSGGKGTGSSATSVGDFTTLLQVVDPIATGGWAQVSVALPGRGAIALRYYVDSACNFACASSSVGIDTLSVGDPPPPPCNLPPIPAAGQTVVWTAAGGPYVVCSDLTIPQTATVTVEGGTVIDVQSGFTLDVDGTLHFDGSASAPVTLTGGISTVTPPVRVRGLGRLDHVDVACRVLVGFGGSLLVADSTFPGGIVSTDDSVGGGPRGTYVQVDRCSFASGAFGALSVTDGTLVVRDTDVSGPGGVRVLRGYLLADGLAVDGSGIRLTRERYTQPAYLDGLTVTNSPGPALELFGWNFQLGANNVLSNNAVPVELTGGLLAGSHVPSTGNVNDHVDVGGGGVRGTARWAKLDVPYVVDGTDQSGGHLTIEPGATVQFTPGSGFVYFSTGDFRAVGHPDDPIRFERRDPASAWNLMMFSHMSTGPRLRDCVVRGGTFGVQADDCYVQVDACRFEDNFEGGIGTTFGTLHVRSSTFANNDTGIRTSPQGNAILDGGKNPNSFVGNGTGVLANGSTVDATDNWWGAPTGPAPIGAGDPIVGPVAAVPFRTSAPPADLPPRVELRANSRLLEVGRKVFLTWEAVDDRSIVSQRVLFSEHGNFPTSFVELAQLPGSARSVEVTVPTANPSSNNSPSFLKVVAVDDAGQEGFDEFYASIPYTDDVPASALTFLTDLSGPFEFGEDVQVCWDFTGFSGTWSAGIVIDGEHGGVGYGGAHTGIECWDFRMPYVSTDTARVHLRFSYGAGNRSVDYYSAPFTIRPDPRLGDAPPAITVTSPPPGATFSAGGVVPLTWSASDDEELRAFHVQASYDDGRTWHTVSPQLPGTWRHYTWRLPSSAGLTGVLARVVATDLRFQSSSDTTILDVTPGGLPDADPSLGTSARPRTARVPIR